MSRVVGTGKTITLTCQTSGIDNGESGEFEIFKASDDSSLGTVSGTVSDGAISADWTAEGPGEDDAEQFWELYYKIRCKDLESRVPNPLIVFTDWVEVEAVDEDDQAMPDAAFEVTSGGETRARNTGSDGKRKEEHLSGPDKVRIEWVKPFELIEWIDEEGPKRKAKVRKVCPAKLVWPPAGQHVQFVNLEASEENPEYGSTLKVKVTLEGGLQGQKGYAKVIWGEENSKRNDPQPELKEGGATDWAPDPESGLEFELPKADGEPDCEYEIELELGLAGGDTCTLMVGGTDACADETLVITTRRQLYYQLTRFKQCTMPELGALSAALDDVAIDYEKYKEIEITGEEGDLPKGALIAGEPLGFDRRLLCIGDHNLDWFKGKFQDDKDPVGAHLMVCDVQYDGGTSPTEQTLEATAKSSRKTFTITEPDEYDVLPTSVTDGESSFSSGTWESTAPGGHPDSGKSGSLSAEDIVFGVGSTPDKFQVVLPADAKAIVGDGVAEAGKPDDETKHPVKVSVTVKVARGPFLGESDGKHQIIVRSKNDERFSHILVHELGHSIKQCLAEIPPGLDEADHGRKYEEKGHQGHHCAYGLSDDEFQEDSFWYKNGTCVMFGEGDPDEPPPNAGQFCDLCHPFVRATDCQSLEADPGKARWVRHLFGCFMSNIAPTISIEDPAKVLVPQDDDSATRLEVVLGTSDSDDFSGTGTLTCEGNGSVKVFDKKTKGTELKLPLKLKAADLKKGKRVYVQGLTGSDEENGTVLSFVLGGDSLASGDAVTTKLTVVDNNVRLQLCVLDPADGKTEHLLPKDIDVQVVYPDDSTQDVKTKDEGKLEFEAKREEQKKFTLKFKTKDKFLALPPAGSKSKDAPKLLTQDNELDAEFKKGWRVARLPDEWELKDIGSSVCTKTVKNYDPAKGEFKELENPKHLMGDKKKSLRLTLDLNWSGIDIPKLDKWFIPKLETCALEYTVTGPKGCADKVAMEVHASNYCKLSNWNDGLPTYTALKDKPVYTKTGLKADARQKHTVADWKGEAQVDDGLLKAASGTRYLNVVFSPYTVHFRYYKKDDHKDAKILLNPFWPQFETTGGQNVKSDSLKIEWEVKGSSGVLEHGALVVVDGEDKEVFRKRLKKSDLSDGKHNFTWDGKYTDGNTKVAVAKMPFRVRIWAHTPVLKAKECLAIAAAHTEVRLYVDPATPFPTVDPYKPQDDKRSLLLGLGPLVTADAEATDDKGTIWFKQELAKFGFHPGPVNATVDDEYKLSLKEFKRTVYKKGTDASAPFERQTIDLNENADLKTALKKMPAGLKRPWFGKKADRSDYANDSNDLQSDLRDPAKELILWVDDRHYYTDPTWADGTVRAKVIADKAAMNNYGGKYNRGDSLITEEASFVARPWIPVQADLPLMSQKTKWGGTQKAPSKSDLDTMRVAVGPLRVDWTFFELDADPPKANDVDQSLYHKERTRSKTYVEWVMKQKQGSHSRKDVKLTAKYHNCPSDLGGIRPTNLARYFEAAWGRGISCYAPWSTATDSGREAIATVVHDAVGQDADKCLAKCVGRAGIYFNPSRVAGDGYQVRAQVRFEKLTGKYEHPNREILEKRYPRLPQAQTAKLRLWRKASVRGFLAWSATDSWTTLQHRWSAIYLSANLHYVQEGGAAVKHSLTDFYDKTNNSDKTRFENIVKSITSGKRTQSANISINNKYIWPWADAPHVGLFENTPANNSLSQAETFFKNIIDQHWTTKYSVALSLDLASTLDVKLGRTRGHLIVEFGTPDYWLEEYECPTCNKKWWYVEKDATGDSMVGKTCPAVGCAGNLRFCVNTIGYYNCAAGHTPHIWGETSPGGGRFDTATWGKHGTLASVKENRCKYTCTATGRVFYFPDSGAGTGKYKDPCPEGHCGGTLYPEGAWKETYTCSKGHDVQMNEPNHNGGSHAGQTHAACGSNPKGTLSRKGTPALTCTRTIANSHKVRNVHAIPKNHIAVSALGHALGIALNFEGEAELWAHEVGHNRFLEHAANAGGANNSQHDSRANAAVSGDATASARNWDRACLMSYASHLSTYNAAKDKRSLCGRCILKIRGWKVETLGTPGSGVKDP